MFTFQILDRGESFFLPIGPGPLSIGSASHCGLRLEQPGIAAEHLRIEPMARDALRLIVVAQDPAALPVRVNGQEVVQVALALGDRIELGTSVLVLGRRVARPIQAQEVLEPIVRSPRREPLESSRASTRLLPWVAVAIALVVALGLWLRNGDSALPVADLERIVAARSTGDFPLARRCIADLRARWAGADAVRLDQLDSLAAEVDATEAEVADGTEKLRAAAPSTTVAEQHATLREQQQAPERARAEAARILLARLHELRAEALAAAGPTPVAPDARSGVPPEAPVETGPRPGPMPPRPEPVAAFDLGALDRELAALGDQHALALELVRQALATAASPTEGAALQERLQRVRAAARVEIDALLEQSSALAGQGRHDEALALLRAPAQRFPESGEFATLHREVGRLQDEVDARRAAATALGATPEGTAGEPRRNESLGAVADLLEQQRRAEAAGDLAAAAERLQEAGGRVEARDPLFAALLRERAADLRRIGQLGAAVSERLGAAGLELELAGGPARLLGTREQWLRIDDGRGEREIAWLDVPPEALETLVRSLALPVEARLGASVLAYRAGDRVVAERLLAQAWEASPPLQGELQGLIRRGRGDRLDPLGYALVKGEFVARRVLEAEKLSRQLEQRLQRALAMNDVQRQKLLEEVLAGGPDALDALILALRRMQIASADRLDKHPLKKTWSKLALARDELDAAREHAKALIFDEQKYFYPYKPPAVDPTRAAEYPAVQREVDERVAVVRRLWQGNPLKGIVPKKLRDEEQVFRWLTQVLRDFGEQAPEVEQRVAWVAALPERELTLRNFARDVAERRAFEHWERIEAFNAKIASKALGPGEREEAEITNSYRRMFGHRPLAISPKLTRAARGHSAEMSRLGYFSHFSPVPERRTPADRMRLEGYKQPVGENCALADSSINAHESWIHSSGHHRNLLMPSHTEFGVGGDGRNWTQNFGRAEEYRTDPEF